MSAQPRWRLGAISVATAAALAAGLASTPAAAAPPPDEVRRAAVTVSAPRSAGRFSVYVPHKGDTLWRISARFCGRGSLYPRLAVASGIVNPNRIYAGRTRVVLACSNSAEKIPPVTYSPSSTRDKRIAKVTAYARAQVGKWYRWGTAGANTYDCSGLVMASYARTGVRLNHYSKAMMRQGRAVSLRALLPGDVVWHVSRRGQGHVAMYLGGGKIIEAPHSGARVRIRAFRAGEWYGARRMI